MNEIKSFDSLMNFARNKTIAFNNPWPSENLQETWDKLKKYFDSFSNDLSTENISKEKFAFLQKLLDLFYKKDDINVILNSGKKNLAQILYRMAELKAGENLLKDNDQYLLRLINKIPKEEYPQILNAVIFIYLDFGWKKEYLREFMRFILRQPGLIEKSGIYDTELFLNRKSLEGKLLNSTKNKYEEVLAEIGIIKKYIGTNYFSFSFFYWIYNHEKFDETILEQNGERIKNIVNDEKKLLFAKIIKKSHDNMRTNLFDEFIKNVEQKYFKSEYDKTEEHYWQLINDEYKTEINKKLLKEAYIYYRNIFTRFIISIFYDSLAVAGDWSGHSRAEFWRRYGSSEQFEDIKLVLTSYQQNIVFRELKIEEQKILKKHIINSEGQSPVALVLIFKTKILVDFGETGNSAQIFNRDNKYIYDLINSKHVYNSLKFKVFTYGSINYWSHGEGRFLHNANWQRNMDRILKANGISPGGS